MFVEQDPPMGVGHLAAALNDFDYHLQDDMAAIASQISPTGTADTLEGLSAEHWASAVQEATRLPPFRDGAHAAGVAAVFGPGTRIPAAAQSIIADLSQQLAERGRDDDDGDVEKRL